MWSDVTCAGHLGGPISAYLAMHHVRRMLRIAQSREKVNRTHVGGRGTKKISPGKHLRDHLAREESGMPGHLL